MTIRFLENEFTTLELVYFLKKAYKTQINTKPFTAAVIRNWIRIKHFPAAYGGYKIISTKVYKEYGSIRTLMIDGLTRVDVEDMIGSFKDLYGNIKVEINSWKELKPRKQRTKLYYDILDAAGKQYTKKTLKRSTLPLYWKAAGIKRNQIVNKSHII